MKSAFIFDLDGTLLDSMGIWETVGYEYLSRKNIRNVPPDLNQTLLTLSLAESAVYLNDRFSLHLPPEQIAAEINRQIEYKYEQEVQPKAGVLSFLEKFKHKKMCVATATDLYLVEAALTRLNIMQYFDFIITSTEVGNSKQHPDIYLQAAERLHALPQDAIVFEDALHALRTAKNAGFYTVGLYEPSLSHDQVEMQAIADCYLTSLSEFEETI